MSKYIYDSSLVGKHSAFNQLLFEKYDIPARQKIKEILQDFVIDNPDGLKQDLIITDKDCKYKYLELQVCTSWINDKFPYDYVYIFERKYKYDNDTLFMTLDKNLSKCSIFDAMSFKNLKPRRVKKYSREFVYDIPWNRIMTFSIIDLSAEIIKLY